MTTSWRFCGRRHRDERDAERAAARARTARPCRARGISRQAARRRLDGRSPCVHPAPQSLMPMVAAPLLAEEPGRPEDHDQQEQDEEEHLPVGRRDVVAAERLHDADADAAEQRALDAAHAAEHDDHEGDQHEVEPDGRKHREQRHHHAGGEPDQRGAAGEGDEEDARHRDAHELRRLAVLHGGADRLAEIGRLEHELQPDRAGDRDSRSRSAVRAWRRTGRCVNERPPSIGGTSHRSADIIISATFCMRIDSPMVANTTTRCGLSSAGLMMSRCTSTPNRNIAGTIGDDRDDRD